MNTLADDPFRVAPPYQAPGEYEPADLSAVTRASTVAVVNACLAGETQRAFGETSEWWCDVLMDSIAEVQPQALLGLLISAQCPHIGKLMQRLLEDTIHETALGLLARPQ